MTDTERERITAICEVAGISEIDDLSDGFHTFKQLYYQRMMLFAAIVRQNKDKAWKSLRHEDGELCFGGGWFIVGIDTPEGSYTYHYEDNYYSLFDCEELEHGKHWDGHTEKDVTRLLSLPKAQLSQEGTTSDQHVATDTNVGNNSEIPNSSDAVSRQQAIDEVCKMMYECFGADEEELDAIKVTLHELPSAQPEQHEGHWILHESPDGGEQYECSRCGVLWEFNDGTPEDNEAYFCPRCGKKLKGV